MKNEILENSIEPAPEIASDMETEKQIDEERAVLEKNVDRLNQNTDQLEILGQQEPKGGWGKELKAPLPLWEILCIEANWPILLLSLRQRN